MNKRAFTVIEMMITISLTIGIVYSAIFLPTQLMKQYRDYDLIVDEILEVNIVRSSLSKDLMFPVFQESEDVLKMGDNVYTFTNEGLYRESDGTKLKLTSEAFLFSIEDNLLSVYNDNVNFKFSINNQSLKSAEVTNSE